MSEARAILDKIGTSLDALDAIGSIARQVAGKKGEEAIEALHIIAVIVDTVKEGFKGKLTVGEVQAEIKSLHKTIADDDLAADQALHDKFDTK